MLRLPHALLAAAVGLELLAGSTALAGSITAELNRTEGELGEAFILTVSIEGVRDADPEAPQVPGLVVRQQGVSESTMFNNGHRVSELQVSYAVYPQQAGDFTIPSFKVQVDGKQEASLPLKLKVRPAGQAANGAPATNGQPSQGQPQGAPGQTQAGKPAAKSKVQDTGGVFLERECDKTSPYVGQQVVCTVRVFHRGNLNGGQRIMESTPEFRRFNLEGEKRSQRLVNGQRYAVIELKEIIVPTKPGRLELPPYTIDARVLTWSKKNNPLDKFFDNFGGGVFNFDLAFTEEKNVTVKSDATPFDVRPLPEAGRPPGFGGLVGAYQMQTAVSRRQLPAGETLTVTVTVSGDGLTDVLADPTLPFGQLGKVYADKPEYKEETSPTTGIHSKKTFKVALVPANPGTFSLGKVEVPTFDPKKGSYVTLSADLGQIIVDPGKAEEKSVVIGKAAAGETAKETVKELGKDLLGLHRNADLTAQQTITKSFSLFLFLFGIAPSSLAFLALGWLTYRSRRGYDVAGQRRAQALRRYREAAGKALTEIDAGHIEPGLGLAYRAFKDYLGDKVNLHGSSLAAREVDTLLGRLGATAELKQHAMTLVSQLESVEFGGRLPAQTQAGTLVKELTEVVGGLEV